MSRPSFGTDRTPVALAGLPSSRGWTAGCLAVGSLCLGLALGAALGEQVRAASARLAQQLVAARFAGSEPAR